jgi:hypothetical protein
MDEKTIKIIAIAGGVFIIAASANIAANALYTHTKIGVDKKVLALSTIVGVGIGYALAKYTGKI